MSCTLWGARRSMFVFASIMILLMTFSSASAKANSFFLNADEYGNEDRNLKQTWPTKSPVKAPPKKKPEHHDDAHQTSSGSSSSSGSSVSGGGSASTSSSSMKNSAASAPSRSSTFMLYISGAALIGAAIAGIIIRKTNKKGVDKDKTHPLRGSVVQRADVFHRLADKAKGAKRPHFSESELDDSGVFA
mmetsp:Transcript_191/g.222  ORF Transcript_191/g.222 Transcript_191/m.222 type:complete len:189 (-) Transcript_191:167-733(-)